MDASDEAPRLFFSTAPSLEVARRLAQGLVSRRLAACVQLVPGIESHYLWEGRQEQASEVLLLIKSVAANLRPIEGFFASEHPYEVPELLAIEPPFVEAKYLAWLRSSSVPGGLDG